MVAPPLLRAAAIALTLVPAVSAAAALDMVVMEARGLRLSPGQVISGGTPLVLEAGQQVTLMSQDGRVVKLRGPSSQAPAPQNPGPQADVQLAMRLLVTQQAARERAGAIRGGESRVPPDPWLIDIGVSGVRCLPPNTAPVLWRADGRGMAPVTIAPSDHSWRMEAQWGAGLDRLVLPSDVPLAMRGTYSVRLGAREVSLSLVEIPSAFTNDAMRAGYMMEIGCDAQAKALFARAGLVMK